MRILIAGLGSIGRRHLRNLVSLGEKDIVLYRTHKSTLPDKELGIFPVENDLEQAFKTNPEAVIISNPTSMHMRIAEEAAKANVHIFLEKPISHTVDSLRAFEGMLKNSSSIVYCAYQFRFNPGLQVVKQLIVSEEMGRPLSFQSFWGEYLPGWHPWEDYRKSYAASKKMGGGVVLTLSHPVDYLRWFFGEVQELFAYTGNLSELEIDVEDTADVLLQYRNGVLGTLHLDYYHSPKKHDLLITCTKGTIRWEYKTSTVQLEIPSGNIREIKPAVGYERNKMYLDEMRHFLQVCQSGVEPICSYNDGKKVLETAWGILTSGKYHERVIFEE
ncbi:MAG: Gfo/Idh/MocA family oxidoreductase [Anaerolineaceae bacterium]|nr:Gfo/Idh/MocA family oxidoreductase [Anaerolineaceae bacterium]